MLYNSARGVLTPRDLAGKRIGVRSWNQTTGGWLRGILADDYGVDFSNVQWFTFEDGHVAEAKDPPGVIRAAKDMTQMLLDGELDAAIYGAAMPDDPRLKTVIADPEKDAREWYARHKFVPVNHMVVVTEELVRDNPKAVAELYRLLEAGREAAPPKGDIDTAPFGKETNRKALELLMSYAAQQQLVSKPIPIDSLY
jgi:4,5-dihydroxyphthalate decarboxylase